MKKIPEKISLGSDLPPTQFVLSYAGKCEVDHREDGPDWVSQDKKLMTWHLYGVRSFEANTKKN